MHGNVWEWCWDWFKGDYYQLPETGSNLPAGENLGRLKYDPDQTSESENPRGPFLGSRVRFTQARFDRVLRGGSWADYTYGCSSTSRHYDVPEVSRGRGKLIGFRVARSSVRQN